MPYQFISLREQPQHLPVVAGWIHKEWWSDTATPVEAIETWLGTHLNEAGFPITLLACAGGEIGGSVSLHETEAEDRPAYRPYLGCLYVKPANRGRGIGVALVRAIERHARVLGCRTIYLNAGDPVAAFYQALDWRIVERGYGRKRLNIMQRCFEPGSQ
jgi:predicted N-acetyltransferase YhbS